MVQSGRLRNKATFSNDKADKSTDAAAATTAGGYVFRVTRNGVVIAEEKPAGDVDLKRLKNVVHEVSVFTCTVSVFSLFDF